jgi:hypothetical protein
MTEPNWTLDDPIELAIARDALSKHWGIFELGPEYDKAMIKTMLNTQRDWRNHPSNHKWGRYVTCKGECSRLVEDAKGPTITTVGCGAGVSLSDCAKKADEVNRIERERKNDDIKRDKTEPGHVKDVYDPGTGGIRSCGYACSGG